jgi:hypothetical protein
MASLQQNIIYRGNSVISVETQSNCSQPMVNKNHLKRPCRAKETACHLHICSRLRLSCRFNNIGGDTQHLYRKLRLIAYVLVFLHASLAAFFLNTGFAQTQNTSQVLEPAQKQEKLQFSFTPEERA